MSATIRINPDESLVEITTPEGEIFGPLEMPEDGEDGEPAEPIFCVDDEDPSAPAYIATVSAFEGLRPNTLYKLVEVPTMLQTNVELVEPDEDDDTEDGEDGGVLTAP